MKADEVYAILKKQIQTGGGLPGPQGVGISKIELTNTEGLVDTYTITYTNGQIFTYTVTNGGTPNIQIGMVQTLESDQQAVASITGTSEEPLLNLGIPKGEPAPNLTTDVPVVSPAYTNRIPDSVGLGGEIYNDTGIKSGYSLNSKGEEIENATVCVSGFISVKKGDVIRIQDPGQSNFDTTLTMALYQSLAESSPNIGKNVTDISNNDLYGSVSISGDTLTWDTSNISYYFWDNFQYLRVTVHSADAIVTINEEIKNITKYEKHLNPEVKVLKQNLEFDIPQSVLFGKKLVVFGDSIIGMVRDNTSVTAYLQKYTGLTVYNVGFGGCRMSVHPTDGYSAFSMWALSDAITSKNYDTQDAQVSSGEDYFSEQLSVLKSLQFDKIDYIVIHYGTNDFGGNVEIDDPEDPDNTSTLCGALRYSLDKIISNYPNIRIFVSVPIYRMWSDQGSDSYENTNGNKLTDFVSALKSVASEYHIPVIDGYNLLGINSINDAYFSSDGTHLSDPGRKIFGEFIGGKIINQGN